MSDNLLYERKALSGLLRTQIRDHLESTRRDISRMHNIQQSLFWKILEPLAFLTGGTQDKNELASLEKQFAQLTGEKPRLVGDLQRVVEQSGLLRQQVAYLLRRVHESPRWQCSGPLRALHGLVSRTTEKQEFRSSPSLDSSKDTSLPSSGKIDPKIAEGLSQKDFLIRIHQDFLSPIASSVTTINGWAFCKRPGIDSFRLRCRIGERVLFAEYGLQTDHVGEHYAEYPQAARCGFDFYGVFLEPDDEEAFLEASVDGKQWILLLPLSINNQIQIRGQEDAQTREGDSKQIAIYYAKKGNYFYREIALYLFRAFEQAGYHPHVYSSEDTFDARADWHLIVSPNEFYFLGPFPGELSNFHQKNILFLLADQPHTPWFKRSLSVVRLARHILDISHDTIPLLKDKGLPATYFPLGYLPGFSLYEGEGNLPLVAETEALGKEVRTFRSKGRPLAARPIDISFVGTLTPRRDDFFATYAERFYRYRCHFRLVGPYHIAIPEEADKNLETLISAGISRRSKIVLNVHRDEEPYFEWHRMVLFGIWQEALVVTEKSTSAPPFVAGEDYVEVDTQQIPDALDYYLNDPLGREEAEKIRTSASKKFRTQCLVVDTLKKTMDSVLSQHE